MKQVNQIIAGTLKLSPKP